MEYYENHLMGPLKKTLSMLQYDEQRYESMLKKVKTESERTSINNKLKDIKEEIESINRSIKMNNGGRIR